MKLIRYIRPLLLLLLLFAILATVSERYFLSPKREADSLSKFQQRFSEKHERMLSALNEIVAFHFTSSSDASEKNFHEDFPGFDKLFSEEEISILVSAKGMPKYWTDNVASFANEIDSSPQGIIKLPNGWYFHAAIDSGNVSFHGLILIKHSYQIQNDYLKNHFAKGLNTLENYEVSPHATAGRFSVHDSFGNYAFSLEPVLLPGQSSIQFIPLISWLLVFVLGFLILFRINSHFAHRYSVLKITVLLLLLMGLYALMNYFHLPQSFYQTDLFSPKYFAFTSFWSSLGELLIFSTFLFFWSLVFNRSFDLPEKIKRKKTSRRIALTTSLLVSGLLLVFVRFLLYNLVMNSAVSFSLYRVEELTIFSFWGYLIVALLLLSFFFFSIKTFQVFRKETSVAEYFFLVLVSFVLVSLVFYLTDKTGELRLSVLFLLVCATNYLVNRKGVMSHRLMTTVIYVVLFSLFVLFSMNRFIRINEKKVLSSIAISMSDEHDPTAELFLKEIDQKMKTDSVLSGSLFQSWELAGDYLEKKYFNGYFREYDFQVTFCEDDDSLVVKPDNNLQPCVSFFNKMISEDGTNLRGTNFYFMENATGRITYFGHFTFRNGNNTTTNLFIELNSKMKSEGIGFPELLLPQHSIEKRLKGSLSFAKYINKELVHRGGVFSYQLLFDEKDSLLNKTYFKKWGGYEHCIYCSSEGNYNIVSRKETTAKDYVVAFPYIFIFFFLVAILLNLFTRQTFSSLTKFNSLRMKIQLSIVGIVFVALLVVCGGTVFYIVSSYKKNYEKGLIDKINAVSIEIESIVEKTNFPYLNESSYLSYELSRISAVFQTDINIYDLSGYLVATSRPELYDKGLISTMMDHRAFHEMNNFHPSSFLQHESIGKMKYLSAYGPVLDEKGEKNGYLNVPYFTGEKSFRQELTTLILAFVNLYVFLLLISILVAYFISSGITGPLKLISEHLKRVQFGKTPIPIRYRSDDELGMLVAQYNRKLEELADSAELLARSEREMAWREMARQIAHEIKNPLTPIKLNIQFLQRTNPKTVDNYDEILNRVTRTIIEQIDNLSSIATEFSNFAKIPRAHNERFNLAQLIEEIVPLFDYSGECAIETRFSGAEKIEVFVDKEQFSRAIINLMKNAIQSIPEEKKGKVIIAIEPGKDSAVVSVADNGKGIPAELCESIFVPNFTTKSSGTGLGLAITKGIVENFGGEIWFTSAPDIGTTFFIRIPLLT